MVYVFLANGFEEIEALIPVDYLRRAGIEVTAVAVGEDIAVSGAHGIGVIADTVIGSLSLDAADDNFEAVFLPGGMPGTKNLAASAPLAALLKDAAAQNKLIAAICAAPSVPGALGLLEGKRACCYPGFENALLGAAVTPASEGGRVILDGSFLTGCAAGAAEEFALKMIEALRGKETADKIAASIFAR